MLTVTKTFPSFPFAHRQPKHPGHCSLIHGHNWTFTFEFFAHVPDPDTGFVIDFGGEAMKKLKVWLEERFDHTLVLNFTDPEYPLFHALDAKHLVSLLGVADCSCEGIAMYLHRELNECLAVWTNKNVEILIVTVAENERNSCTYGRK